MNKPTRYTPALVYLHWIIALLIFLEAGLGIYVDNFASPGSKPGMLGLHMMLGTLTLLLMFVRIFVRRSKPLPEHATAGNAFFDMIGKGTHYALYALVIITTTGGIATSMQGALFKAVSGETALPVDFFSIPAFVFHILSLPLLILLIFLHIGAAIYHQLILKDNLFARMSTRK